ncbi:MAG TPA: hypothetical protein VIP80_11570 [Gemmatimonadales bacterium]|jgi:Tfp pilus assembly protein PilO
MPAMFQVAVPPSIPLPPQADPTVISSHTQETILLALVIIAISAGVVFLLKPLVHALARRLEGRGASPALQGEVEALREQVAELDPLRDRVHELEERMEFTERMLAQRREQDLLPRQGP